MIIYLIPIGSFIIGWLFFYLLLKIFFSKSGNRKLTFLGILKSQKPNLAKNAASLVQKKVLESNVLKLKIEDPALMQSIKPGIEQYITYFLEEKLVKKYPIITVIGGDEIVGKIKKNLLEEMDLVIPQLLLKYAHTIQEKIPIKEIVEKEILKISELEVQTLVLQKTKSYLLYFPLLGGILAFIISMISMLILKAYF